MALKVRLNCERLLKPVIMAISLMLLWVCRSISSALSVQAAKPDSVSRSLAQYGLKLHGIKTIWLVYYHAYRGKFPWLSNITGVFC